MKIEVKRPDLKHEDPSMTYLPYRVCEDCYLLFETMNEIKHYQIEIARYFRNPVDSVNFGVGFFKGELEEESETADQSEETSRDRNDCEMYRILLVFTDLFWSENIEMPEEPLFLVFEFLGKKYKVPLERHLEELDYFLINFYKIYTILYNQEDFNAYIDKNRVKA